MLSSDFHDFHCDYAAFSVVNWGSEVDKQFIWQLSREADVSISFCRKSWHPQRGSNGRQVRQVRVRDNALIDEAVLGKSSTKKPAQWNCQGLYAWKLIWTCWSSGPGVRVCHSLRGLRIASNMSKPRKLGDGCEIKPIQAAEIHQNYRSRAWRSCCIPFVLNCLQDSQVTPCEEEEASWDLPFCFKSSFACRPVGSGNWHCLSR